MSDPTASPFEQTLDIETPERVRIRYELAGIGSRFAAGTIDFCLLFVVLFALFLVAVFANLFGIATTDDGQFILLAFMGAGLAVVWAYYLLCELTMGGQTPGKRLMKLRVVSEQGGPAPASALFVRNVLRVVDCIPLGLVHVLGGVVMFASSRSKRLGDMVAGTVVVQEREIALNLDRLPGAPSADPGRLSSEERTLVRRFLDRRNELRPIHRVEVAARLAAPLRERLELPAGDDEELLALLAAGRSATEVRDLAGPRLDAPDS